MAAHASMRAAAIVACLRPVALVAEGHGVRERDAAPIGQVQGAAVLAVVAAGASELAMADAQSNVGPLDAVRARGQRRIVPNGGVVAGRARHHASDGRRVRLIHDEAPEHVWGLDRDWMPPRGRVLVTCLLLYT